MLKLLKGGTLVTENEIVKKDLLIQDEKIVDIDEDITVDTNAAEFFNVTNKMILPGLIDSHTHFTGAALIDDVTTGSMAGAFGGVTTFIDYFWQKPNLSIKESFDMSLTEISGKSLIDFSLHCGLRTISENSKHSLSELKKIGVNSLKIFTTFRDGPLFPLNRYSELFGMAKALELLLTFHAEDDEIIFNLENQYTEKGLTGIEYFSKTRPPESEAEAIKKIGAVAAHFRLPVYIVHVSSKMGMDMIRSLRADAVKIYCETRPPYLILSNDDHGIDEIAKYLIVPPLRSKEDQVHLLDSLRFNEIQTIASDHCAQKLERKLQNKCLNNVVMGLPGIESMLPLVHHFAVNREIIDYQQMICLLSANPAKIFGLYPQKGSLKIGTDADIVIFDPDAEVKLSKNLLHSNGGFTAFENVEVKGYPVMTFLRGRLLVNNGKLIEKSRPGKFIKGGRSMLFD